MAAQFSHNFTSSKKHRSLFHLPWVPNIYIIYLISSIFPPLLHQLTPFVSPNLQILHQLSPWEEIFPFLFHHFTPLVKLTPYFYTSLISFCSLIFSPTYPNSYTKPPLLHQYIFMGRAIPTSFYFLSSNYLNSYANLNLLAAQLLHKVIPKQQITPSPLHLFSPIGNPVLTSFYPSQQITHSLLNQFIELGRPSLTPTFPLWKNYILALTIIYPSHLTTHSLLHKFTTPESPIPTPMYTLWTNRGIHSYLTSFYFSLNYTLTKTRLKPHAAQLHPPSYNISELLEAQCIYILTSLNKSPLAHNFHPLESPILTSLFSEQLNPSLSNSSSLLDKPTLTPI